MDQLKKEIASPLAVAIILVVASVFAGVCFFYINQYENLLDQGQASLLSSFQPSSEEKKQLVEAPFDKDFLEAAAKGFILPDKKDVPAGESLGYIPSPNDNSHLKGKKLKKSDLLQAALSAEGSTEEAVTVNESSTLPATFDLRSSSRVSPVKNQGSCGSCWAFATYGSLESNLLPAELWDFSENNLKNYSGFDILPCSGGNSQMSLAYLARWSGPVDEKDDPYIADSTSSLSNLEVKKYLKEVLNLPPRSSFLDNDNIKNAVYLDGGVYTIFYYSSTFYNSANYAYYASTTSGSNHAVTIVGWNDSYDRNKFNIVPPGDGAFIVKNSWGTSFGSGGYFYISYYDTKIGNSNAVFMAQDTTSYDHIYQYDPLGFISSFGYSTNTAWFANVFTSLTDESLTAVALNTSQIDTDYQILVYLNPDSGPISSSGPIVTQSGTVAVPGYHTITLTSPVALSAGNKFSIVVKAYTPNYKYPIPLEKPISGYSSKAAANAGESYVSRDGLSWSDLTLSVANANVCVKGFTSASGEPSPGDITPPEVSITSPANGTTYTDARTITIVASASDNVGVSRIDFYDNNLFKSSDTVFPYNYDWTVSGSNNGTHSFTAVAFDSAGNSSVSGPVNLIVNIQADLVPPSVSLTSPTEGSTVSGTVSITADASDNMAVAKVNFYRDGGVLIGSDTSTPYQIFWDTASAGNGAHNLYAQAYDLPGNSSVSKTIKVIVSNDTAAPTVSISYPANNATFKKKSTITITATASDDVAVAKVEFYINKAITCTDSTAPYSCYWVVPNALKSYQIQAKAYDAKGNVGSSSIITVKSIK